MRAAAGIHWLFASGTLAAVEKYRPARPRDLTGTIAPSRLDGSGFDAPLLD